MTTETEPRWTWLRAWGRQSLHAFAPAEPGRTLQVTACGQAMKPSGDGDRPKCAACARAVNRGG